MQGSYEPFLSTEDTIRERAADLRNQPEEEEVAQMPTWIDGKKEWKSKSPEPTPKIIIPPFSNNPKRFKAPTAPNCVYSPTSLYWQTAMDAARETEVGKATFNDRYKTFSDGLRLRIRVFADGRITVYRHKEEIRL